MQRQLKYNNNAEDILNAIIFLQGELKAINDKEIIHDLPKNIISHVNTYILCYNIVLHNLEHSYEIGIRTKDFFNYINTQIPSPLSMNKLSQIMAAVFKRIKDEIGFVIYKITKSDYTYYYGFSLPYSKKEIARSLIINTEDIIVSCNVIFDVFIIECKYTNVSCLSICIENNYYLS